MAQLPEHKWRDLISADQLANFPSYMSDLLDSRSPAFYRKQYQSFPSAPSGDYEQAMSEWRIRFSERKRCAAHLCPHCARGDDPDPKTLRHRSFNSNERCGAYALWKTLPLPPDQSGRIQGGNVTGRFARNSDDVRSAERWYRESVANGNYDVVLSARVPPNLNACPACAGTGVFNDEECWHCGGEGVEPTL